ncbi:MAG: Mrp/NBP35 family ATP-binding protein [candidate division WOR-3 bacterium]
MTSKKALDILRAIEINGKNLVSGGFLGNLTVEGGRVEVVLNIPEDMEDKALDLQDKVRDELLKGGFQEVVIKTKLKKTPPPPKVQPQAPFKKGEIPGVKNIIAVASGKGGVGKSTFAVNLAYAFKRLGYKVGLFDADIYGPTITVMLGLKEERMRVAPDKNKFLPPERFGVKVVSFGILVDEKTPILWRGAMFHKAYEELMLQTDWGELDFLVVDLPPGTGDAQLSLAQLFDVKGVLMITTPQLVAIADVLRAINGFEKLEVKVLGIVENMAYFVCPDSGKKYYIFGQGGGKRLSEITGVPLLASIPIDEYISTSGDNGIPVVEAYPDAPSSKSIIKVAESIIKGL